MTLRIYTMHDHWLVCPMYDLWKHNRRLCEEPGVLSLHVELSAAAAALAVISAAGGRPTDVDLFLAPSESVIREHPKRGFTRPMRLLPHFVPLAEATAPPPVGPIEGPRPDRPYFLFVGRLVRLKGVHMLIDASVDTTAPTSLVAGDGDSRKS